MAGETVPVPELFDTEVRFPIVSIGRFGRYKGNIQPDKLAKIAELEPAKLYDDIKVQIDSIGQRSGAWSWVTIPFLENMARVNVPGNWVEYLEYRYGYARHSLPEAHSYSVRMGALHAIGMQMKNASSLSMRDEVLWRRFINKLRNFELQNSTALVQAQCRIDFEYYSCKAAGQREVALSNTDATRLFSA